MALGYRAILTADATQGNLDGILDELRPWFAAKGFPGLPTEGEFHGKGGRTLKARRLGWDGRMAFR